MNKSSTLLISDYTLQVIPSLAAEIGLNEAIFLQQLQYWSCKPSMGVIDQNGTKWIRNSIEEWENNFPFWSKSTIRRIILELENKNLVLTTSIFNQIKFDKTKWYTINYDTLKLIEEKIKEEKIRNVPSVHFEQMDLPKRTNGAPKMNSTIPKTTTKTTTKTTKHSSSGIPLVKVKDSNKSTEPIPEKNKIIIEPPDWKVTVLHKDCKTVIAYLCSSNIMEMAGNVDMTKSVCLSCNKGFMEILGDGEIEIIHRPEEQKLTKPVSKLQSATETETNVDNLPKVGHTDLKIGARLKVFKNRNDSRKCFFLRATEKMIVAIDPDQEKEIKINIYSKNNRVIYQNGNDRHVIPGTFKKEGLTDSQLALFSSIKNIIHIPDIAIPGKKESLFRKIKQLAIECDKKSITAQKLQSFVRWFETERWPSKNRPSISISIFENNLEAYLEWNLNQIGAMTAISVMTQIAEEIPF